MSDTTARFYQPMFGNDNVYAPEVIDLKTFSAPVTAKAHAAKADAAVKLAAKSL